MGFFRRSSLEGGTNPISGRSISSSPASRATVVGLIVFGIVFLGPGLFITYFVFGRALIGTIKARQWTAVPCVVDQVSVVSHPGKNNATYSITAKFTYRVNGQVFHGNRFDFSTGSSSGQSTYTRLAAQYPVGSRQTCYVDPANPSEAVLNRGFNLPLWLCAIVSIFPAAGLLALVGGIVKAARAGKPTPDSQAAPMSSDRTTGVFPVGVWGGDDDGRMLDLDVPLGTPVTLKSKGSAVGGFIGVLVFAGFWNGVVFGGLVVGVIRSWRTASGAGYFFAVFMTLFATPFVAVGVGLIGVLVYQFMTLFNPRATVSVSTDTVPLGGKLEVSWTFRGNVRRITRVTVTLRGVEEAEYRRGTSTFTDRNTFASITLADVDDPNQFASGRVVTTIPSDTMHTLKADNNRIVWELCVRGEIRRWPDVNQSFVVNVTPVPVTARSQGVSK